VAGPVVIGAVVPGPVAAGPVAAGPVAAGPVRERRSACAPAVTAWCRRCGGGARTRAGPQVGIATWQRTNQARREDDGLSDRRGTARGRARQVVVAAPARQPGRPGTAGAGGPRAGVGRLRGARSRQRHRPPAAAHMTSLTPVSESTQQDQQTSSTDSSAEDSSTASSTGSFAVHLDVYEGPFDLLLGLISKHKLDITEVALSQVTDEFIAHIARLGPEGDLEQTTEFLLVASTLLDLKASRLLPKAEVEDEEDLELLEARDLLFARLLQYRA